MAARALPSRDLVKETTPLRLAVAAALAFPDGSMGASGLRREAAKGNLAVERIAGKDYTTLKAIEEMRERCRAHRKAPACGSNPSDGTRKAEPAQDPHGPSGTDRAKLALAALLQTAKAPSAPSPPTSQRNTKSPANENATPPTSLSRTS